VHRSWHNLELVRLESIVDWAELVPGFGDLLLLQSAGVLGEHDGEANFQVPIDVTVKEPGTGIVGDESEGRVVRNGRSSRHNVANNRIDKVVGRVASTADHMEVVPVEMEGVRSTWRTAGNADLDDLVGRQSVYTASWEEVLS